MSGTGGLAGRHLRLANPVPVSYGDATSSGLLTRFAVNGNNTVFPPFNSLSGTNHSAQRLGTVIAGTGKISQERVRKLRLFNRGYSPPVGGASGYVVPVFTGNSR